jgi:DMSO/TMAO reductase YedYZ molybdopterin-dependent catalytic subunit
MRRIGLVSIFLILIVSSLSAGAQQSAPAKAATGPTEIKIGGDVTVPLVLTAAEIKNLPRTKVPVENSTSKKTQVYEGVLVEDLLKKAGAPMGSKLSGPAMAAYVLVEAADNYRVIFSLAEFDSGFQESNILLADTLNGLPLAADQGPFKLIAPHEKRPARWVKMVKSIAVVQLPK